MPDHPEDRAREQALRRLARRNGLELHRSRVRDQRVHYYGTYAMTDPSSGAVVHGDPTTGAGLSLDQIEAILTAPTAAHI